MIELLRRKPAVFISATVVVVLCALLRWSLNPYVAAHPTLTVLLPAVVFAGYLGGLGGAMFATILSAIAGIFIMELNPSGRYPLRAVIPEIGSLLVVGGAISLICRLFHLAREKAMIESARRTTEQLDAKVQMQREAESQLRHLADTMPHLIWIARADGYHEFYNRRWYDYVGDAAKDTRDGGWVELLHLEDRQRARESWQHALRTGEPYEIEYRFLGRDGKHRWFLSRALPLRDERGVIQKWFGSYTDIHDAKLDEIRDRFLLKMEAAIRTLTDPQAIIQRATRMLVEHLKVNRCAYSDVDAAENTFVVFGDYTDGVQSMVGRFGLADFSIAAAEQLRAGEPFVLEDASTDPRLESVRSSYRLANVAALICVPIHRGGVLTAAMAVHSIEPRKWTADDIELVAQVASRCWESIARARVERELRENEQRLRLAQEVGRIGSFEWSIKEDVVVWTPELEALYGLPPGGFKGGFDAWRQLVVPEDAERIATELQETIRERKRDYSYEFRALAPNQRMRWLRGQARFFYDDAGQASSMIGVNIDIDAHKRNEEAAREVERRFRNAILNAPIPVIMHAEDGEILELSRAFTSLTGYQKGDFAKFADWLRAAYGDEADSARNMMSNWTAGRVGVSEQDFTILTRDGERRIWRFAAASPGMLPDGRRYLVAMAVDVTEQRRIAEQREALLESERAARMEQERIGRMKDEFLATLSHELRTPLNAILGWAQILSRDLQSRSAADINKAVETIQRNARVQSQLIDDLLDMSRIISGKISLKVEKVDPAEVLAAAIESVRPTAEAKSIRLVQVLDTTLGPITGDAGRLQQVFWNLLTNAIKFTPKNGKVEVVLRPSQSRIEVSVTDNGQGIAPEFLPYVFDRFRQADGSISRKHGGLGLGLAIVKQIVEMHGGTVQADSPGAGHGATFTVSLPQLTLHRSHTADPHGPSSLKSSQDCLSLAGLKVLVVDDEPDARLLVQRFLEECHAVVTAAENAQRGLQAIQEIKPDILVSDIGMPEVDGLEFIRRVRTLDDPELSRMPAIALTAFARKEDRRRALHAGYQMHLSKPVDASELVAAVANLAHVT